MTRTHRNRCCHKKCEDARWYRLDVMCCQRARTRVRVASPVPHHSAVSSSPHLLKSTPFSSVHKSTPFSSVHKFTPFSSVHKSTPFNSVIKSTPFNSVLEFQKGVSTYVFGVVERFNSCGSTEGGYEYDIKAELRGRGRG